MNQRKRTFTAAVGLLLVAIAPQSFAGRYGDDDLRHSQQTTRLQQQKSLCVPAGNRMKAEAPRAHGPRS